MINKINNNTSGNYRSLVPGLHNSSCGEDCNCESCNPSEKNKTKTEIFIEKAKKVHGDRYDYQKVDYVNNKTKVTIICRKHGIFLQTPNNHLKGRGCPMCSNNKKLTLEEFIEKAKKVHGENRYDYSKVDYVNAVTKITITCSIHGEFLQNPYSHLNGQGCPKCGLEKLSEKFRKSKDDFIKEAKKIHGDKFSYGKVKEFKNVWDKVTITCPIHGDFEQRVWSHLRGQGCPMCNSSHMETNIRKLLIENDIDFKEQWNWDWLKYKSLQYVDFYLPDYNTVIECQGAQHFKAVSYFGGDDTLKYIQERDENKLKLCREYGIRILYYSNLGEDFPYPYNVITDTNFLIDEIKKGRSD